MLKKQKRQKKSRKNFKKQNFSAKSRRGGRPELYIEKNKKFQKYENSTL